MRGNHSTLLTKHKRCIKFGLLVAAAERQHETGHNILFRSMYLHSYQNPFLHYLLIYRQIPHKIGILTSPTVQAFSACTKPNAILFSQTLVIWFNPGAVPKLRLCHISYACPVDTSYKGGRNVDPISETDAV